MLVAQSKKADYDVKTSEIENKYYSTSDYEKFMSNTIDEKITQKSQLIHLI